MFPELMRKPFIPSSQPVLFVTLASPATSGGLNLSATGTKTALAYNPISIFGTQRIENIHMIWVSAETYSNSTNIWLDGFTSTVSHEIVETMSDPDGNGIHVDAPVGLPAKIRGDNQIGDNEPAADRYGYRLNGVWVQPYWSQVNQAFLVPDGNSQRFTLNPLWNGETFTYQFDLNITGDQLGVNFADDIKIQSAGAGGSVTMNNQSVVFDPHQIHAINIDTRTGFNTVEVYGLPYGVTLNLNSTSILGNDAVVIGRYSSIGGVLGTVNVNYTVGRSSLVIDDANDIFANGTVTDHSVTSGLVTINYIAAHRIGPITGGVTSLTLNPGRHATVNVVSVGALTDTTIDCYYDVVIYGLASGKVHQVRVN
jgi:hypothetical protein